ncbi:hypothetical protein OF83DRAFT_1034907, partial [Amylostereum chailletii]
SRHAASATERQRMQLERLLKDPAKPAYVPPPPKEKTIRPAREMMKNVQGSSAGAGSGEFHVYKASRRREYERLKAISDSAEQTKQEADFEARKRAREEEAEARTSKNRAKRQKKKERTKSGKEKGETQDDHHHDGTSIASMPNVNGPPLKKKRLVNGKELVFKRPGEESEEEGRDPQNGGEDVGHVGPTETIVQQFGASTGPVTEAPRIIIHEDD